jgi:hypothetical protein
MILLRSDKSCDNTGYRHGSSSNKSVGIPNKHPKKNMLLLGLITCLLWAVRFYLLGALTGTAMNLLATGRLCVYYRIKPSKQNAWISWLFVGLTSLATALTWQGAMSLLPFIGTTCMVVAFWQTNPKITRRLALASSPPWIIYSALVGSYPVIVAETLLLGSNFIGQYRFDFNATFRKKLSRVYRPT